MLIKWGGTTEVELCNSRPQDLVLGGESFFVVNFTERSGKKVKNESNGSIIKLKEGWY